MKSWLEKKYIENYEEIFMYSYVEYGAHCYESAQCAPPSISLITQDFSLA